MKYWPLMIGLVLLAGCQPKPPAEQVIAKVGACEITRDEFEGKFKASSYGARDTADSRRAFLNNMINQKLIILDAQARGLDKDKSFLRRIENFWEQSLVAEDLQQRSKDGENLDQWLENLKKNTPIEINQEYLK